MRKSLVVLLLVLVAALVCAPAMADTQGVTLSAIATMETPYHQVTTLIVEYPEAVVAPTVNDYSIIDYNTSRLMEVYENRPYEMGAIAAVYTNDAPERREDKTSVAGKYVVIEITPVEGSYYDEEAGMWRPDHVAGIATVREDGARFDYWRRDWSLYVVTQLTNVVNEAGEVVAERGVLPTLNADAIVSPELARYEQMTLKSENGLHDINYSLSLPENYDESKKYAVVFCQPGMGGSLDYTNTYADGSYKGIGGNVSRDIIPIAFTRVDEDLIVVAVQPWTNAPEDWQVDNVGDYIYLVEYIRDNYAVDTDRIYGLGNSMGTMYTSQAITRRPDLFTAYAQCNGCFVQVIDGKNDMFTIFNEDVTKIYADATEAEIWALCNDPANRLDAETIAQKAERFSGVLEHKMPIYFFDGANTEVIGPVMTISPYLYLKESYEAMGCTPEEIEELVQIDLADKEEFLKYGVCEFHESTKIVVMPEYDVIPWLLSRTRAK